MDVPDTSPFSGLLRTIFGISAIGIVLLAVLSFFIGIMISYLRSVPTGACIVVVDIVLFAVFAKPYWAIKGPAASIILVFVKSPSLRLDLDMFKPNFISS